MSNFSVGDVVRLKSGGPKMTVVRLTTDGVSVAWFTSGGVLCHGHLSAESLRPNTALDDVCEPLRSDD